MGDKLVLLLLAESIKDSSSFLTILQPILQQVYLLEQLSDIVTLLLVVII